MQNSEKLWPIFLKTEKVAVLRIPFQSSKILDIFLNRYWYRYPAFNINRGHWLYSFMFISTIRTLCKQQKSFDNNEKTKQHLSNQYDRQIWPASHRQIHIKLWFVIISNLKNPVCLNRETMIKSRTLSYHFTLSNKDMFDNTYNLLEKIYSKLIVNHTWSCICSRVRTLPMIKSRTLSYHFTLSNKDMFDNTYN
jgi:hypothetical protein